VITKEELKALDLHEGDVVTFQEDEYPDVRHDGPLHADEHGCLAIGSIVLVPAGEANSPEYPWPCTIKVVKRMPKPFYVNALWKTEPTPGDVARSATSRERLTYIYLSGGRWYVNTGSDIVRAGKEYDTTGPFPEKLELLVDGDTGHVVLTSSIPSSSPEHDHDHDDITGVAW
jgi:hypothetical protein